MTQTALITGASSGIGLTFAHKFAQEGYHLVLVARSGDALQHLADELITKHGIQVLVLPQDLAQPNAAQQVYDAVVAQGLTIDVLVNNAGFATYGFFHELDVNKELAMIQLNVATLVHLTHLFLPGMVARRQGKILNVASTAAFYPGPLMATYYATKAFVLSFSEAIDNEVKDKGVTVSALCPGPTESGFQARANMEDVKLVQSGLMTADEVVEIGYQGLMQGKPVIITGTKNRLLALSRRIMPRGMTTSMVRNVQERITH